MRKIGIYIHIPFCARKCDYCDFLSAPGDIHTQELYFHALCRQIRLWGELYKPQKLSVCSIFIGGGTPSIWCGTWIGTVLDTVRDSFFVEEEAEITIECNPGTLTREKLAYYRPAGVNRLSIGLQCADNTLLKRLGRIHTWEDFLESYRLAREEGFENINIDLMSALPDQTMECYEDTLRKVIALSPEHISAYSLIVEEGTPFYTKDLNLPDEDVERKMYYRTKELLLEVGYGRYEISNYARPGFECRHNLLYWTGEEYLGFGVGAASLFMEQRFKIIDSLKDYVEILTEDKNCLPEATVCERLRTQVQTLTKKDRMEEFCFLGLRRTEGIFMDDFEGRFGVPFMKVYGDVVLRFEKMGLLRRSGTRLALTERGIDVSNMVLAEFLL